MGYYIETDSVRGKAGYLVEKHDAMLLPHVPKFEDVPADKAIICVVNNEMFEAAGLVYSPAEFKAFNLPTDGRIKKWLLMDKTLAHELSGYVE